MLKSADPEGPGRPLIKSLVALRLLRLTSKKRTVGTEGLADSNPGPLCSGITMVTTALLCHPKLGCLPKPLVNFKQNIQDILLIISNF